MGGEESLGSYTSDFGILFYLVVVLLLLRNFTRSTETRNNILDVVFDGYILLGGMLKAQLGWTQRYRHFHPPCRINREIEVLLPSALGSDDSRSHAGC